MRFFHRRPTYHGPVDPETASLSAWSYPLSSVRQLYLIADSVEAEVEGHRAVLTASERRELLKIVHELRAIAYRLARRVVG